MMKNQQECNSGLCRMLATVVATGPPHTTDEFKRSCFLGHADEGFFASESVVCPLLVVSDDGMFTWKFRQPVIALGWLQSDIACAFTPKQ
jgi:hypothetical protein